MSRANESEFHEEIVGIKPTEALNFHDIQAFAPSPTKLSFFTIGITNMLVPPDSTIIKTKAVLKSFMPTNTTLVASTGSTMATITSNTILSGTVKPLFCAKRGIMRFNNKDITVDNYSINDPNTPGLFNAPNSGFDPKSGILVPSGIGYYQINVVATFKIDVVGYSVIPIIKLIFNQSPVLSSTSQPLVEPYSTSLSMSTILYVSSISSDIHIEASVSTDDGSDISSGCNVGCSFSCNYIYP